MPQGSPLSCVDMSNEINGLLTFVRNVRSNIQKREVLFKLNKVIGVQMAHNQHPFKQKDVVRAMRSAKAGGMETIEAVEVITKDGITIRVLGRDANRETTDTPEGILNQL